MVLMENMILKRPRTEPTPLIKDNTVTFVWRGRSAPRLVGDFTGWDEYHPVEMEKTDVGLWTYQHSFDPDAYIEYAFVKGDENLLDPCNPHKTQIGIGVLNNFLYMP
jgi:hypothetical protein